MNKEQVYDEKINPLMAQIIEICEEHGIAMFCDFAIPTPEDNGLMVSTVMPDNDGKHPAHHRAFIALKMKTTDLGDHAQTIVRSR